MTTQRTAAFRTIAIQGQTVCADCWTHAMPSAEENYWDYLVEQIGRDAATARANALQFQGWSDADLAEIDRWALALFDDGYGNGVLCGLHMDETDAYAEDAERTV